MTESPLTDEAQVENTEQPQEPEINLEPATFDPEFEQDLDDIEHVIEEMSGEKPSASILKQEYLESTVLPLVLEGLHWIMNERPSDPVEHLAMFLLKNNNSTQEPPSALPSAAPTK